MRPRRDNDPFALMLMPPPDETREQRQVREAAEAEAKRVSDEIDKQIRREIENKRKNRSIKLLFLGKLLCLHSYAIIVNSNAHITVLRPNGKWKNRSVKEFVYLYCFFLPR